MKRKHNARFSANDSRSMIRNEKPTSFTLKFQTFSLLRDAVIVSKTKKFESRTFNAGDYKWKLGLYPHGDPDHISLYLVIADHNILSTTLKVEVLIKFLVYDHLKDKYLTVEDGKVKRFSANRKKCRITKMLPLETFNDPSNGFLVDDCCVFGVDISVMNYDIDVKEEVFSLIKQPRDSIYKWIVNNFLQSEKIDYVSDSFTLENYNWKIRLCDSKLKPDFLYFVLNLDSSKQILQGSRVYVEFEMAILSQFGDHTKKTSYAVWFEGSRSTGWGSSYFISLTDLKEPSKGFIYNNSIIVELKINVISTFNKVGGEETTNCSRKLYLSQLAYHKEKIACKFSKSNDGEGEIFSLIKPPKYCKYTWKVKNFSQFENDKNNVVSSPFNVENHRWKISFYPKGDSSIQNQDFMSLYLILDNCKELPQNSQIYAEFEVTISSQLGGHEYKGLYSSWFECGHASWGVQNFISLTKLKDSTKGFIYKDTMIIEVKINVISTFKKIE